VRSEMNVPAGAMAPLVVVGANDATQHRLERHDAAIKRLARVDAMTLADAPPAASAQLVLGEATFCLPLGGLIDLAAEGARLQKELGKVTEEIARIHKKLSNERFVMNAAPEIVEGEREKLVEFQATQEKLAVALSRVRERSPESLILPKADR